jgi:PAS domain S-box-containing protein
MKDKEKTKEQLMSELEELHQRIAESEIQRERAEMHLRDTAERFRAMVEAFDGLMYVCSQDYRIEYMNERFIERTGYNPTGEICYKTLHDLDSVCSWCVNRRVFNGETVRWEVQSPKDERWYSVANTPMYHADGSISKMAMIHDITERKQAEEALRESEERYRRITEAVTDYIFTVRVENGRPVETFHGAACEAVTGYTSEEFSYDPSLWIRMVSEEDHDVVREQAERILSGHDPQPIEHGIIRKDGLLRWVSNTPVPHYDGQGNLISYDGLIRDITERKRAEEALRESEERYRTVLEANPDPVAVCDMEGEILYLNPAFERVFRWTLEERLGKTMNPFVPEENWPETRMMIDKVLAGESFSGVETRRYTKEGQLIPVSVSGAVYRDKNGKPIGSVISLRDISEQKKLEAQLQHAQKMEAVGTLAGGIAHEFNNLLQAVQGYAELLLLRSTKGEASYRELQGIVRAAKRGGELTQQLLTFSRKVESNLCPVDLNLEVEKATRLLERTIPKMIEIELRLSKALRPVNADPDQIEQILVNLAVNAKDAMRDGGKLAIATEDTILDEEYCRRHTEAKPGQYVLLTVSDTGHGMEKDTLKRIFEPFFTTKGLGEGTGIGLAIVYGIVKNHGGHITCSSEPGAGTTFKIYLPAIEQEVQTEKEIEPELHVGGTETILLVDDEQYILKLGEQILSSFGYTVLTALDGESALELYRNEQGDIDLVILDLIMPGMSGRECLAGLRKINPRAKVVIASGYSDTGPMQEAIEAGAKSFIGKPYEMKQLLQVAREVLDED